MTVVQDCRRTWRRLGVQRRIVEEMATDLAADLAAAEAEGQPTSSLVGPDTKAFARAWAMERGVARPRLRLALTTVAAVVGAIPGVGFALFAAYGLTSEAMAEILPLPLSSTLALMLYSLGAVFAYAGSIGAVAVALRVSDDLAVARTVRFLAIALPVAIAASVGGAILYAYFRSFSTATAVALVEVVVAMWVFVASVACIRWLAVLRERTRLFTVGESFSGAG